MLIGIAAVAFLLWEPHIEGRNAHSTTYQIYFDDSFLIFGYIASIPFLVVLYQAFKVLGLAGENKVHTQAAAKALRWIKYCAITMIGFVVVGEIIIRFGDSDDRAGGVFMGVLITFGSIAIYAAAAKFERMLQRSRGH